MPDPDDLEERLTAMLVRRGAEPGAPQALDPMIGVRVRRRHRLLRAGVSAAVVVALLGVGVWAAHRGPASRQVTTAGATACYPAGIPAAVADLARHQAQTGMPIAGQQPRARVVAIPEGGAPGATVPAYDRGGWVIEVSGKDFDKLVRGPPAPSGTTDVTEPVNSVEVVYYDRNLSSRDLGIGDGPADLASVGHVVEVSLAATCDTTTTPSVTTPPLWQDLPAGTPFVPQPLRSDIIDDATAFDACMRDHGSDTTAPIGPTWGDGRTPTGTEAPVASDQQAAFDAALAGCRSLLQRLQEDTSAGLAAGSGGALGVRLDAPPTNAKAIPLRQATAALTTVFGAKATQSLTPQLALLSDTQYGDQGRLVWAFVGRATCSPDDDLGGPYTGGATTTSTTAPSPGTQCTGALFVDASTGTYLLGYTRPDTSQATSPTHR